MPRARPPRRRRRRPPAPSARPQPLEQRLGPQRTRIREHDHEVLGPGSLREQRRDLARPRGPRRLPGPGSGRARRGRPDHGQHRDRGPRLVLSARGQHPLDRRPPRRPGSRAPRRRRLSRADSSAAWVGVANSSAASARPTAARAPSAASRPAVRALLCSERPTPIRSMGPSIRARPRSRGRGGPGFPAPPGSARLGSRARRFTLLAPRKTSQNAAGNAPPRRLEAMDSAREQRVSLSDFELIESRADLDALAQDLLGEKILAFDTEADSFYHYFDKTCLVQIATRATDLPDRSARARRRPPSSHRSGRCSRRRTSARSSTRPSTTSSCSSATAPSSSQTCSTR